jgi:hypothetical protein
LIRFIVAEFMPGEDAAQLEAWGAWLSTVAEEVCAGGAGLAAFVDPDSEALVGVAAAAVEEESLVLSLLLSSAVLEV